MTVGTVIREARLRKGMTQMDLAVAIGKSLPAVSQWERDVFVPRRQVAVALDEILEAEGAILAACGYVMPTAEHSLELMKVLADQVRLLGDEIASLRSELDAAGLLPQHASPALARSARPPKVHR